MKKIFTLLFSFAWISLFAQIQQNINKTNGTFSNAINQLDSIRFDTINNQIIIITANGLESHLLSDVINVTFSQVSNGNAHTCGTTDVHNQNITYGSMTDQNNNLYKTVIIGSQEWMAENLIATTYQYGDTIPNITNNTQWSNLTTGAFSLYNNDIQYECPYGKIYNWFAVTDARNVCPSGWHVPSNIEWNVLIAYIDSLYSPNALGSQSATAGGKLKSIAQWNTPNTGATNEFGLSLLPGGNRDIFGLFYVIGTESFFWSSTAIDAIFARYVLLKNNDSNIYRYYANKVNGMSVRCLRD